MAFPFSEVYLPHVGDLRVGNVPEERVKGLRGPHEPRCIELGIVGYLRICPFRLELCQLFVALLYYRKVFPAVKPSVQDPLSDPVPY